MLAAVHAAARSGGQVVESLEMEEPVDEAEEGFVVGRVLVDFGMVGHDSGSEEDLAIGEGNDIGRCGIVKKFVVHATDGGVGEDGAFDQLQGGEKSVAVIGLGEAERQGKLDPPAKPWQIVAKFALAVGEGEFH
jgi:hypothetical protein